MSITMSLAGLSTLAVLTSILTTATAQTTTDDDCPSRPNVAAIVVGTIAATLAVVAVILAIGLLWWRRQQKAKNEASKRNGTNSSSDHNYDNPNFQTDIEGGRGVRIQDGGKGFGGYVECREYEASHAQGKGESNGGTRMQFTKSTAAPKHRLSHGLQKAGSRGSLDNSIPNLEPEVISVLLESRDMIGLGFDICGSMRDGIYVSQVHNRGPAIETGLIKIGDRVLSMTISFENMVLEDALTIISYASPYPVRVLLQKAASLGGSESFNNGQTDLQHSLYYRSQSLNDLSQISKDGLMGPRKAFSDMRTLPMERNKKRTYQSTDILEEGEPKPVQQRVSDSSIEIHDMKIDSADLRCESPEVIVYDRSGTVSTGEVIIKVGGDDDDDDGESVELQDTVPQNVVPVKDTDNREEDSLQTLSEEDKLAMIRLSYENPEASEIYSAERGVKEVVQTGSSTKLHDSSNVSMDVNVNDNSIIMRDEPTIPLESSEQEEEGQTQKLALRVEDEGVRAVLRDYFSGQPALMEQFGISEKGGDAAMSQQANVMVDRQSLEAEGAKACSSSSSEASTPSSSFDKDESPATQRRSDDGLSFDMTPMSRVARAQEGEVERKGGMAYYVRMEEPHNPIPEIYDYSFPKVGDVRQPPLIDVSQRGDVIPSAEDVTSEDASDNNNVSDSESVARKKRVIHPAPVDLSDENGCDDEDGKSTASHNGINDTSECATSVNARQSVEDITMIRYDGIHSSSSYHASPVGDETEA